MGDVYKVWVSIERIDEDADIYEDVDLPWSAGEYDTLEEAQARADALLEV